MACNCLCCGCTNCAEGAQGPCCCGGSSGTCCAAGEYCCAGVCQAEPCGCPSGCPDVSECNLVVILDYGTTQVQHIDYPATDYYYNSYTNCELDFSIADLNSESGGDIDGFVTVGYDANCCPTVADSSVTFSNPDAESFPTVIIKLDCNCCPLAWSYDGEATSETALGFVAFLDSLGYSATSYTLGGVTDFSASCCTISDTIYDTYTVTDGNGNDYTFTVYQCDDNPLP